jgi:hypothetical protein
LEEWIGVGCELSCRNQCVGVLLKDIKEYVLFALNYMQVRIIPIEMHIGGEVVECTLPKCTYQQKEYEEVSCKMIFRVSLPYYIEDLSKYHTPILRRRLMNEFKSLILKKRQQFMVSVDKEFQHYSVFDRTKSAARIYIKKAYNVLVHKLLDSSGLLKLSPFETRVQILKHVSDPSDCTLIDKVLNNIISFLSTTYIIL